MKIIKKDKLWILNEKLKVRSLIPEELNLKPTLTENINLEEYEDITNSFKKFIVFIVLFKSDIKQLITPYKNLFLNAYSDEKYSWVYVTNLEPIIKNKKDLNIYDLGRDCFLISNKQLNLKELFMAKDKPKKKPSETIYSTNDPEVNKLVNKIVSTPYKEKLNPEL